MAHMTHLVADFGSFPALWAQVSAPRDPTCAKRRAAYLAPQAAGMSVSFLWSPKILGSSQAVASVIDAAGAF